MHLSLPTHGQTIKEDPARVLTTQVLGGLLGGMFSFSFFLVIGEEKCSPRTAPM